MSLCNPNMIVKTKNRAFDDVLQWVLLLSASDFSPGIDNELYKLEKRHKNESASETRQK
jgi:hypothetical protein